MNQKHQKKNIEKIAFDNYADMREVLNEQIPEIFEYPKYNEIIDFWGNEEIPMYCYYEALEHFFIDLLNGKLKDEGLLERVLDFMENMANSNDDDVQTLLVVQILEVLFGLDYAIFNKMERRLLRPSTLALFQNVKKHFRSPQPPTQGK